MARAPAAAADARLLRLQDRLLGRGPRRPRQADRPGPAVRCAPAALAPRAAAAQPPPRRADDTSIFNALPKAKQELFVKLGFYLLAFFLILYHTLRVLIFLILPWTKNYLMSSFLRPFSSTKKT